MFARLVFMAVLLARLATGANPAGFACPVPRAMHTSSASDRAAHESGMRPEHCCGVIINGAEMSATGVICWPLLDSDDLTSQSWPVILVLFDGGRVLVGETSHVKLISRSSTIEIVNGVVHWVLPAASQGRITVGDRPIASRRGMATLRGGRLDVNPDSPFPQLPPDAIELLRRFPYTAGYIGAADVP